MERSHPPLRRVLKGNPQKVDPTLCLGLPAETSNNQFWPAADEHRATENDSCYSSCSEESHSSLSRESSDGLGTELQMLNIDDLVDATTPTDNRPPEDMLVFAKNLGYSEAQLVKVLAKVGRDAGQDKVLSELVSMSRGASSSLRGSSSSLLESSHNTSQQPQLRSIVIDGSNIAMSHGRREVFSCAGIRDCVQFFVDRGHTDIIVFIPQFRREAARSDCPITDQHVLVELNDKIVWTPSRRINGRRIVCHDDRYILKTAEDKDAVIVSNDEYRDLVREHPQYSRLVENRLLMYSFVDGKFMPPDDPLGRHGPKLDQFLSKNSTAAGAQQCPYGRKCTYGNKCKYFHPERPNGVHVSVTDRLMKEKNPKHPVASRSSMQFENIKNMHSPISRTRSLNNRLEVANQENTPSAGMQRPMHLPVHCWHEPVGRNQSMPLPVQFNKEAHHHLYAPSTAVWGHSELSVGPLNTNSNTSDKDQERARLQYNLCQLFPEPVVITVMAAHPEETRSQFLCEQILAMERSFCGASTNN